MYTPNMYVLWWLAIAYLRSMVVSLLINIQLYNIAYIQQFELVAKQMVCQKSITFIYEQSKLALFCPPRGVVWHWRDIAWKLWIKRKKNQACQFKVKYMREQKWDSS